MHSEAFFHDMGGFNDFTSTAVLMSTHHCGFFKQGCATAGSAVNGQKTFFGIAHIISVLTEAVI